MGERKISLISKPHCLLAEDKSSRVYLKALPTVCHISPPLSCNYGPLQWSLPMELVPHLDPWWDVVDNSDGFTV